MKSRTLIITATLSIIMALLLSNCKKNGKEKPPVVNNDKPLSVKVQLPSESTAIRHIQTHVARTKQMVMVPSYYYKEVQKRKPCDQYDYDLGKCSGSDGFSRYGYKMVTVEERTCCHPKEKMVSKIRGNWVATYVAPKDEWEITLEYKDDDKQEQQATWSISLSPSNGVQVSVGG